MPVVLETDASVSKSCCAVGYTARRQSELVSTSARLAEAATRGLSQLLAREAAQVEAIRDRSLRVTLALEARAQALCKLVLTVNNLYYTYCA